MAFVIARSQDLKTQLQEKSRLRRTSAKARTKASSVTKVRNDLQPKLKIQEVPIDQLKVAKRRIRKKDEYHIGQIEASLKAFGQVYPVLLNRYGTIVDGHLVVEAARRTGLSSISCTRLEHLDEDEARLLSIALNRIQETGDWEIEALAFELADLESLDLDLGLTGFSVPELDAIMIPHALPIGADEIPEEPDRPVSRPGDLWCCGPHRVLCGSALDPEDYSVVMGGKQAAAVVTDPPYNTKIKGHVSGLGKHKHEDFIMASGEMSEDQFQEFLANSLRNSAGHCSSGAVVFAFMDWRQFHCLRDASDAAKLHHINTIVWDKGSGGMGALYRSAHEFVGVFCTAKSPAVNNVQLGKYGRDRTNVQHYPGANQPGSSAAKALKLHATPKPVELISDLMCDVTEPEAIVLDPFLGSGTALIAAETVGRTAFGIELDPKFVDVTVRRWEEWTGSKALHCESGKTFEEVSRERL